MTAFVKGLELCESFFNEIAKPILSASFPSLRYAAGVIGYGSEVIGFEIGHCAFAVANIRTSSCGLSLARVRAIFSARLQDYG